MTIEADVARLQAQYERRKKEREEKTRGKDLVPVREHMQDAYQSLELRATAHEGVTGCRTGFVDLDLATGGLQKGHMAIVAGRPAMGKTSWALNVAVNSAKAGHHVGIYSLEMSTRELLTRALCTEARADAQVLRAGKLESIRMAQYRRGLRCTERITAVYLRPWRYLGGGHRGICGTP